MYMAFVGVNNEDIRFMQWFIAETPIEVMDAVIEYVKTLPCGYQPPRPA